MSRLVMPTIQNVESKENYGRFVAEPLEKGFGITLGNALRRALLGYLTGAAIVRVKLDGVQHEFSTIPHLKEDATDFMLNIRAIRLKALSGQPGKLTLDMTGAGQITAADIKPSNDFTIVNPEQYLATLDSEDAKLYAEFDVELGEGYRPSESSANLPIGTIPLDAVFSPVTKVNFTTEPIHIGEETSRQRLYLEIWTDGTLTPEEALNQAANTLIEQLTPFASYAQAAAVKHEEAVSLVAGADDRLNVPIEQLDLSTHTINALRRGGVMTVGELVRRGEKELMSLRNFGQKSKQEVEDSLKTLGLSLASEGEEGKGDGAPSSG